MKKTLIFFPLWLLAWAAAAQTGFKYLNLSAGASLPQGSFITLNFETVGRYHNTWEFGGEFYTSTVQPTDSTGLSRRYNWLVGPVYKPLLVRSKNISLRLPVGLRIGSNGSGFITAPQVGLELCHTFSRGLEILVGQKTQYVFNDGERFRAGAYFGLRIPLN